MTPSGLTPPEKKLRRLLQLFGIVCLPAFVAFVMPASWMQWCHEQMGLGSFPLDSPITIYLARSTSALSGIYGLFALLMARDVRRYERFIYYHIRILAVVLVVGSYFSFKSGIPIALILPDCLGGIVILGLKYYYQQQARNLQANALKTTT